MSNYYGRYRTRDFQHIFPDFDTFDEKFKASPFCSYTLDGVSKQNLTDENIKLLFYSLYARYGSEHVAGSNEPRAIYRIFSTIAQYGPTWQARLDAQRRIQSMSVEELQLGSLTLFNEALHDQTEPSTGTAEELTFINSQRTQRVKRNLMEALELRDSILRVDVTEAFLDKFKKIFQVIVEPTEELLYYNEIEEDEE